MKSGMSNYAVHRKSINWNPKSISWNFDRFEKIAQNHMWIKIRSRESQNTKNYTGLLFLNSYIKFLCQLVKKFTQELKVQLMYNTIHLHPATIPLHPIEKHLWSLQRIQNQCRTLLHTYKCKRYTICRLNTHKYMKITQTKFNYYSTVTIEFR